MVYSMDVLYISAVYILVNRVAWKTWKVWEFGSHHRCMVVDYCSTVWPLAVSNIHGVCGVMSVFSQVCDSLYSGVASTVWCGWQSQRQTLCPQALHEALNLKVIRVKQGQMWSPCVKNALLLYILKLFNSRSCIRSYFLSLHLRAEPNARINIGFCFWRIIA